jgi:hypothetical protein
LAAYRAIIGVDLELFGPLLIGLTFVFWAMFSDLSEQVTDECVGEDSLRVELLTDLMEVIVHWVSLRASSRLKVRCLLQCGIPPYFFISRPKRSNKCRANSSPKV